MTMTAVRALLLLGTAWCTTACSLVFPSDEYTSGNDPGAGNGLQGDALVARYFINEAASGTEPLALLDSSSTGLDLSIGYEEEAHFGERAGNRGLFWDDWADSGAASGLIGGTAVGEALSRARQATIELVVAVDEGPGTLLSISDGMSLVLTMDAVEVSWMAFVHSWSNFPVDGSRRVLHLRVDTDANTPLELFTDAARLQSAGGNPVIPDDALPPVSGSSTLWLGNENDGSASIRGGILYLAIYGSALTKDQIEHNRDLLLVSDDGP
jgi:hypothetical protein